MKYITCCFKSQQSSPSNPVSGNPASLNSPFAAAATVGSVSRLRTASNSAPNDPKPIGEENLKNASDLVIHNLIISHDLISQLDDGPEKNSSANKFTQYRGEWKALSKEVKRTAICHYETPGQMDLKNKLSNLRTQLTVLQDEVSIQLYNQSWQIK